LENLEISNLNTFVGKNDSGKSSILKALVCFFYIKKFDVKDIFKGKREEDVTFIEISFLPSTKIDDLALDYKNLITIKKEFIFVKGKISPSEYYLCNDFIDEKYQNLWNKKEQDLNKIVSDLGEEPNKSDRGKKIVKLFDVDQSFISRHIRNIFKNGEVDKKSNVQKMHIPNSDKAVNFYSLDVILSVGYRTEGYILYQNKIKEL
jgi:predicted ATP-dependent endonuclease of OLD family